MEHLIQADKKSIYKYLDKQASKTNILENKIVILPYFLGEKTKLF